MKSRIWQKRHMLWHRYRTNDSVCLSLVVSMMVLLLFCTCAADELEPLTKLDHTFVSKASKIVLFLLLVCCVKPLWRRMTREKIAGLLFVALLFGVSFCITRDRTQVWGLLRQYCLTVLPIAVVVSSIDDHQRLLDSLLRVSRVIAVCAVIILAVSPQRNSVDYSMGLANSLTLPAVMLLYGAFRSRNVVDLLLTGATVFVIFMLGSRGALLGIIVFFLLLLAVGCSRKDQRLISLVCIALICLVLMFWKPLLTLVGDFLKRTGFSSRTLQLLLEGNIIKPNRRNELFDYMKTEFMAHPFAIRGVGGELPFISSFVYAHNLVYELLMDFGAILGGSAVLYILYQAGRTVWHAIRLNSAFSMAKLIFFSISVPLSLVSGTIWTAVYLWCWLVLCDKRYPAPVRLPIRRQSEEKLLSVVLLTGDSGSNLLPLVESCAAFLHRDFELVIQSDAEDDQQMRDMLSKDAYDFVSYHHNPSLLSAGRLLALAAEHASGRYVCFLRDGDLLSEKLVDFVAYMEQKGIDAAVFSPAWYVRPEAAKEGGDHQKLIVRSFDGQMRRIKARPACRRFLRTGAADRERLPRLYGGVMRRSILGRALESFKADLPDAEPDLAVDAAVVPYVKTLVFFNAPLIVQGTAGAAEGALRSRAKGRPHIGDWLLRIIRLGGVVKDNLSGAVAARKYIDEEIEKVPFPVQG